MDLSDISKINRARCERWHSGGEEWSAADWSNALGGESGELALAGLEALQAILTLAGKTGVLQNTIKKVRRHETSVDRRATGQSYNTPELSVLLSRVKDEIADIFLYLDLVANNFDLELEECIFPKFNRVSKAQGFPERLG
jgi:hypothetical protein